MKTLRAFLVIVVGLLCAIASFGSAAHAVCDPNRQGLRWIARWILTQAQARKVRQECK
jgi:hypothetical protein